MKDWVSAVALAVLVAGCSTSDGCLPVRSHVRLVVAAAVSVDEFCVDDTCLDDPMDPQNQIAVSDQPGTFRYRVRGTGSISGRSFDVVGEATTSRWSTKGDVCPAELAGASVVVSGDGDVEVRPLG